MSKIKDKFAKKVFDEAGHDLIALFYTLELKDNLTATIVNDGNGDKFQLTLKKIC